MTQEQIIEGNKLIEKFLDADAGKSSDAYYLKRCKSHSEWDWLMPAVEKIETIQEWLSDTHHTKFTVIIYGNVCNIEQLSTEQEEPEFTSDPNAIFPTKIESTWYNVVQFIKWHNSKS